MTRSAALDLGADDYLTKPFGVSELLARIRVALAASRLPPRGDRAGLSRPASSKVDLARRQVCRGGEEAHLTPTEYKLLAALVQHAGRVVTHRQLLQEVWGANYTRRRPSTSACTWRSSGTSSSAIRPGPAY